MRVCKYNGLLIAVLTRNEHCPPHVHVGTATWDARFEFSFWYDSVCLWDVNPPQNAPKAAVLEELRQVIQQSTNLRNARALWWSSRGTLCLDNLHWDPATQQVVSPKKLGLDTKAIVSARFDSHAYKTLLHLDGAKEVLEIEL